MSRKKTSSSLTTDISYELGESRTILKELQNKPEAEAFKQPVDWKGLNLPDYPQIIKKPMDLQTIETKLNRKQYANAFEFAEDMGLVWSNAKTYNQPGSGIFLVAESLGKSWEQKFNRIRKVSAASEKKDDKATQSFQSQNKAPISSSLGENKLRPSTPVQPANSESKYEPLGDHLSDLELKATRIITPGGVEQWIREDPSSTLGGPHPASPNEPQRH